MNPVDSTEIQLSDLVLRIKERFPGRAGYRDQIRELARDLFFTFGQRPSAQRVVSLLADNGRSPSMSTAQEEINGFWENLRKTARIRIQRPDVPEVLLDHFGQLASDVWQSAVAQSEATTQEVREEAVRQVLAITEQRDLAQAQCNEVAARNTTLSREIELLQQKVAELDQAVAAERARRFAAEASAGEWKAELENTQQIRRQEAELAALALNGVQQQVEQLMSEQRRLLTVADDFKQAALRDRVAREGAESRLTEVQSRCDALLAAKESAEGQQQRLAGQIEQLQRDLAKARSDRDSVLQTTAVEIATLRSKITEIETAYQRQTLLLRRHAVARNKAIQRAWRFRRSLRPVSTRDQAR